MSAVGLTLRHYAGERRDLDRTQVYVQDAPHVYTKPRGFWVSVLGEDDWPSWCRSEGFAQDRMLEHEVTLRGDAKILTLTTPDELAQFSKDFGIAESKNYDGHSWVEVSIDWSLVASKYDGIIIAPYQWSQRLDVNWYYGWDCASGCIWNLDAIVTLSALEAVEIAS